MTEPTILENQNRDRLADQLFDLATLHEERRLVDKAIAQLEERPASTGRDAALLSLKMRRLDLDDKIADKTPRPSAAPDLDDLPF